MSFSITTSMVEQFNANVIMLSQQLDSRLQKTCQKADVTGRRPAIPRSGGWIAPVRWHGYRSWTNANG